MIEHYPLLKRKKLIKGKHLFLYILLFPNHEITAFLDERKNKLITLHIYPDLQQIKLEWQIKQNIGNIHYNSLNNLIHLYFEKYIDLVSGKIQNHSDLTLDAITDPEIYQKMFMLIQSIQNVNENHSTTFNDNTVKILENDVEEETSLPESFFEEIINRNKNQLLFEEYLRKRNEENKEI